MKFNLKKNLWFFQLLIFFLQNRTKVKKEKKLCKKLLFYGTPLTEVLSFRGFCYLCIDLFKNNFDEIALNHNINRLFPKTLIKNKSIFTGHELEIIWSHTDHSLIARQEAKLNLVLSYQEYIKKLEIIYPELKKLLLSIDEFKVFPDSKTLTAGDDWKFLSLSEKYLSNDKIKTCLDSLDINKHFGFYPFISKLEPNSYIAPHCGSTTFRHRIHLGISIPEPKESFIKVDTKKYYWEDGKAFVFDDSLIHEVTHEGNLPRVVLIVDVWPNSIDKKTRKFLEDNFFWLKNLAKFSN